MPTSNVIEMVKYHVETFKSIKKKSGSLAALRYIRTHVPSNYENWIRKEIGYAPQIKEDK